MDSTYSYTVALDKVPGYIVQILGAFPMTAYLLAYSLVFGMAVGFLLALMQLRGGRVLSSVAHGYISFMRGVPALVMILLLYMGLPQVIPALSALPRSSFIVLAMTLLSSSNFGEMMRASYLSVDAGQTEAALSVGMTERQAFTRIVLPQAVATAVPNFGNNLVQLLKDTALAFSIGIMDLMGTANAIQNASYGSTRLESYIAVALIYWALCLIIQCAITVVERVTSRGRAVKVA